MRASSVKLVVLRTGMTKSSTNLKKSSSLSTIVMSGQLRLRIGNESSIMRCLMLRLINLLRMKSSHPALRSSYTRLKGRGRAVESCSLRTCR